MSSTVTSALARTASQMRYEHESHPLAGKAPPVQAGTSPSAAEYQQRIKSARPNALFRFIDHLFGDGTKAEARMGAAALGIIVEINAAIPLPSSRQGTAAMASAQRQRAEAATPLAEAIQGLNQEGVTNIGLTKLDRDGELELLAGDILGRLFGLVSSAAGRDELLRMVPVSCPSLALQENGTLSFSGTLCLKTPSPHGNTTGSSDFQCQFRIPDVEKNDFGLGWMSGYGELGASSLSAEYLAARQQSEASWVALEQAKTSHAGSQDHVNTTKEAALSAADAVVNCFREYMGLTGDHQGHFLDGDGLNKSTRINTNMNDAVARFQEQCTLLARHAFDAQPTMARVVEAATNLVRDATVHLRVGGLLFQQWGAIDRLNSAIAGNPGVYDKLLNALSVGTGLDFRAPNTVVELNREGLAIGRQYKQAFIKGFDANKELSTAEIQALELRSLSDCEPAATRLTRAWQEHCTIHKKIQAQIDQSNELLDQAAKKIQDLSKSGIYKGKVLSDSVKSAIMDFTSKNNNWNRSADTIAQTCAEHLPLRQRVVDIGQEMTALVENAREISSASLWTEGAESDQALIQVINATALLNQRGPVINFTTELPVITPEPIMSCATREEYLRAERVSDLLAFMVPLNGGIQHGEAEQIRGVGAFAEQCQKNVMDSFKELYDIYMKELDPGGLFAQITGIRPDETVETFYARGVRELLESSPTTVRIPAPDKDPRTMTEIEKKFGFLKQQAELYLRQGIEKGIKLAAGTLLSAEAEPPLPVEVELSETTPANSRFTGLPQSIANSASIVAQETGTESIILLPEDGACQFRGILLLNTRDRGWSTADNALILEEVNKGRTHIENIIKVSLDQAIDELKLSFPDAIRQNTLDAAKAIYAETIENNSFTLYSATGLGNVQEMRDISHDTRETLADLIGGNLNSAFGVTVNGSNNSPSLVQGTTRNHYNVKVPAGYLNDGGSHIFTFANPVAGAESNVATQLAATTEETVAGAASADDDWTMVNFDD